MTKTQAKEFAAEKLPEKISDGIDRWILALFLLVFLFGGYCLYDSLYLYYNTSVETNLNYHPKTHEEVQALPIAKNAVAWLTINDTNIDYPIMQGVDNMEYLNKDPYGKYSLAGSIFLDSRNSPDFTDEYSLIYGHHMEAGLMFGGLDEFRDKAYFDQHRTGLLIVKDKEYEIVVFAELQADAKNSEVFETSDKQTTINFAKEHGEVFYEPRDGNIMALSTCTDPLSTSRTVVLCEIISE